MKFIIQKAWFFNRVITHFIRIRITESLHGQNKWTSVEMRWRYRGEALTPKGTSGYNLGTDSRRKYTYVEVNMVSGEKRARLVRISLIQRGPAEENKDNTLRALLALFD